MTKFYSYIVLVILGVACQSSDLKNMEELRADNLPDQISRDVKIVYSDSGRVKFIIESPVVHEYTQDTVYSEFPEGVKARFFNKYGEETSNLWAGYALKVKQDEEVIFRDSVRFENSKKEILKSEELYLLHDTIYSDTTVFIETPKLILEGVGLKAPQDFSTYKMLKPVGVYYANENDLAN